MKNYFFTIIISLILFQNIYSQKITSNFIDAINYSVNYKFQGNNYIIENRENNYYDGSGAMAYMQSRYDYGFDIMRNEIYKLNGLVLINKKNIEYISKFKDEWEAEYYRNNYINVNLGDENNLNIILKRITYYINSKWTSNNVEISNPIADEIKLLKKIDFEFYSLKNSSEDFFNSKRWIEIKSLIIELENCEVSEIKYLATKYNIY